MTASIPPTTQKAISDTCAKIIGLVVKHSIEKCKQSQTSKHNPLLKTVEQKFSYGDIQEYIQISPFQLLRE